MTSISAISDSTATSSGAGSGACPSSSPIDDPDSNPYETAETIASKAQNNIDPTQLRRTLQHPKWAPYWTNKLKSEEISELLIPWASSDYDFHTHMSLAQFRERKSTCIQLWLTHLPLEQLIYGLPTVLEVVTAYADLETIQQLFGWFEEHEKDVLAIHQLLTSLCEYFTINNIQPPPTTSWLKQQLHKYGMNEEIEKLKQILPAAHEDD